jgi:hypothetical protein
MSRNTRFRRNNNFACLSGKSTDERDSEKLFVHGQEAEPAAKLGKIVGKTKRRMSSKYVFRLRVSPRRNMDSSGFDSPVSRSVGREQRYSPLDGFPPAINKVG